MDHKLLEFGTKLQFNPLLQVLWAQRLYSIFCPGKQSQIIFVKKKKKKAAWKKVSSCTKKNKPRGSAASFSPVCFPHSQETIPPHLEALWRCWRSRTSSPGHVHHSFLQPTTFCKAHSQDTSDASRKHSLRSRGLSSSAGPSSLS